MQPFLCFLFILLSYLPIFGKSKRIISLSEHTQEVYVVRDYVEYFDDTIRHRKVSELFTAPNFKRVPEDMDDFSITDTTLTYWLRFSVVNLNPSNQYRLEIFDHDIKEVSLYYIVHDSLVEAHFKFDAQFEQRDLYHKNIGFTLSLPLQDTLTFLLKFRSNKENVLEPVIRSLASFYRYSLIEYTLLGFFYGFTCIIIVYNLVYFLSLGKSKYLYYLIYMASITMYLMSRNGTGFQFLWPDAPQVNSYMEIISSTVGVSFLLLFTNAYLNLHQLNKKVSYLLLLLVIANLCLIPVLLMYQLVLFNIVLNILFVQVAFVVTQLYFVNVRNNTNWFLWGFIILNVGFVISCMEYLHIISSSIWSFYSLYVAINLQFFFISLSLAQGIRQLDHDKKSALTELLEITNKNQMMRILALKKQMSPHFIFNALNSILQRIHSDHKDDAANYLVKFSKLIRKTLEQSDMLHSTLYDELEALKLYLSLETMRVGDSFIYSIDVEENLQLEQELIPSFIIQPFVENSIWHGLKPKAGNKNLWIRVKKTDNVLIIEIEDNGIGRQKSASNKKQHDAKSSGMRLIAERMDLLNKQYQSQSSIEVLDLYNAENLPTGTKVIIKTNFNYAQIHQGHHH